MTVRVFLGAGVAAAVLALPACGVPRAALRQAEAQLSPAATLPADDAAVRQQLSAQAALWRNLSQTLHQKQWGGILFVDGGFVALVDRTAGIAQRQKEILDAHQDDPAKNRRMLQSFDALWQKADAYLNR